MIYTDPAKRHDYVLLFDVTNGNPNGDPDADNLPRIDPETMHGLVSDVAIKRKVRDYVAMQEPASVFIQSEFALNTLIFRAYRETGLEPLEVTIHDDDLIEWLQDHPLEGFDLRPADDGSVLAYGGEAASGREFQRLLFEPLGDDESSAKLRPRLGSVARELASTGKKIPLAQRAEARERARDRMCGNYFDIRMFGAVLSTGLNAGQVRGPMQVTFARSIDPILPLGVGLTRKARTTLARLETGATEIGRKAIVPYGLYRAHGFYNPFLGRQTGATEADLRLFWTALCNMFEYDRSAARGEMVMRGVYIFTHDSPLGNAPAHRLFSRVRVTRNDHADLPRSFEHYTVQLDKEKLPTGITLTALEC